VTSIVRSRSVQIAETAAGVRMERPAPLAADSPGLRKFPDYRGIGLRDVIFEQEVDLTPLASYSALMATGIPCNGPRYLPLLISVSAFLAAFRPSSESTSTKAFRYGSTNATHSRNRSIRSEGEMPCHRRSCSRLALILAPRGCRGRRASSGG